MSRTVSKPRSNSHLEFYLKHGIIPVTYNTADFSAHLERRSSLYRTLSLPPFAIKGTDVLEVAPGTGQNSLYIASCMPNTLTLVEPNPVASKKIRELYATPPIECTSPTLVEAALEDYVSSQEFDIVICENWLGRAPHELVLLRKLAGMVRAGGFLIVTTVSPIGILPNIVRRVISASVVDHKHDFQTQVANLSPVFAPHLATMPSMTRTVDDWIQDNMLNPAYFDLLLSIPLLIETIGGQFEALGTNPVFAQDWRWFKSLHGVGRDFNAHLLSEYWRNAHNFLDHTSIAPPRHPEDNMRLERDCLKFVDEARNLEQAIRDGLDLNRSLDDVLHALNDLTADIAEFSDQASIGLRQASAFLARGIGTIPTASDLSCLGSLFGRETVYASFAKSR